MPVQFKTKFVEKNLPKDKRIPILIKWGKKFGEIGIAPETKGNLSFRTKSGFIITGTGTTIGDLKPEDFVEVTKIEKKNKKFVVYCKGRIVPSMESVFHKEIYNFRSEINAVFHLHDKPVLEVADKLKIFCTEKEQIPGSYSLVKEIRKLLEKRRGIDYLIIQNHGIISLGKTLTEAGKLVTLFHRKAKEVK
jgi:ribulose-5-phosphate 4-epimerase/fuculose-1-phosphate aldolase